ncbi:MAG: APC family permease [Chloroflexi bacterium]|nr:APC family permease [Chloroflexota bacterium]
MADGDERGDPAELEQRTRQAGRLPGDRYVRIVRPKEFRRGPGGIYVATAEATRPRTGLGRAYDAVRHVLFGKPIETAAAAGERLSKKTGLAILASDNISSSSYATEEAMRILVLAGTGALFLTMPIAFAVVGVLAIVVLSETRVIRAYPQGGGSYAVAKENLGIVLGVVAAAALLIDYVLTVAVSTAAGVAALGSFIPAVHDDRAVWGLAIIAVLAIGNLRGIREAGVIFAAPTYVYLVAVFGLIGYGLFRVASGDVPAAAQPPDPFPAQGAEVLGLFLILKAFSSGAVGLTGSEAVANGTPNLRRPQDAVITVVLMGSLFATIFLGLTFLATTIGVVPSAHERETLNSVLTRSIVGQGPYWWFVQGSTAVLLLLAANTGFTGFPRLASVLANDRFMPRQFAFRGERLSFSFGIIALALIAALVLWGFHGSVTELIPLYTVGVFIALTLSQAGLVRRWWRLRPKAWQLSMAVNVVGALGTGVTLVIVAVTKFERGAWMVLVVLPALVLLLIAISRHYRSVADALTLEDLDEALPEPRPPIVIVPIARLDRAAVQALAFATSISPHVKAVHIASSQESAHEFERRWERWAGRRLPDGRVIDLDTVASQYRALIQPLLKYIDRIDERDPRPITVVLAEFVPRHWWEFILHSQTAFRLKAALLFRPNTIVIDVPYHFRDTADLLSDRRSG